MDIIRVVLPEDKSWMTDAKAENRHDNKPVCYIGRQHLRIIIPPHRLHGIRGDLHSLQSNEQILPADQISAVALLQLVGAEDAPDQD